MLEPSCVVVVEQLQPGLLHTLNNLVSVPESQEPWRSRMALCEELLLLLVHVAALGMGTWSVGRCSSGMHHFEGVGLLEVELAAAEADTALHT